MIKSGAVIQNRYLNNPYPTNYNPMGRPGNFDMVRPHDSSSVFDTGMPKDVSPYQPRVAVSVEIQPKSVFKPRRLQRQLKQVNGAKWGQTALKSIFGGEENVITNYMAQRLLGIVEGKDMSVDTRPSERMVLDNPFLEFRDGAVPSLSTISSASDILPNQSISNQSFAEEPMVSPSGSPREVTNDLSNLSLGEEPLEISIPDETASSDASQQSYKTALDDSLAKSPGSDYKSAVGSQTNLNDVMEAIAEVETMPIEAAKEGELLSSPDDTLAIVQETAAGPAAVRPRIRLRAVDKYLNRFYRVSAARSKGDIYGEDDPDFFEKYWKLSDYGKLVSRIYKKYLEETDPDKKNKLKKEALEWLEAISKTKKFRGHPQSAQIAFKRNFPRLYNSFGLNE